MSEASHSTNFFIRDNDRRGMVADFLREKVSRGSALSVVSAYFTIYAYDALKEQLATIDNIRLLFGEPRFIKSLDPDRTEQKHFRIEDDQLDLVNRLQQKAKARSCRDWLKSKAEIRSIRTANLLHGKLYHIENGKGRDTMLGSSNFTCQGLGLGTASNIELNLVVDNERDRVDLKVWFDELWSNDQLVVDVKKQVLNYLDQLYIDHPPELIYFKTLYHVFEKFLSEQAEDARLFDQTDIIDKDVWKALFDFQKDGAKGAIHKINTHGGCILADSVGLGKTYTALAVIKYYELRNHKVLVLCPKKLRDNWTLYQAQNNSELNPFLNDKFAYTVLSHTDLSRDSGMVGDIDLATLNWGNYDLIVIDESHNFRNNTPGKRDEDGKLIRKSRYERLMEDIIQAGVDTKVMLLSATPVNNNLKDLRNQLSLITEDNDSQFADSLNIGSLKETLAAAQRVFTEWAKKEGNRDVKGLIEKLSSAFFKLLDELTIARSRRHIEQYYKSSLDQIGRFPERDAPESIFSEIDLQKKFLSYDRLNDEIHNYRLSLFNPTAYILKDYREQYDTDRVMNFSQEQREHFLIGMMKVNFLKRLESSVRAFRITMERTEDKIKNLERRIAEYEDMKGRAKAGEVLQEALIDANEEDDELAQAYEMGAKLKIPFEHLDLKRLKKDLQTDRQQLTMLADAAKAVTPERDAKLKDLRQIIEQKVKNPTTNVQGEENRKVIVFCAFADTATYLYEELREWAEKSLGVHIALVSGGARPNRTTYGNVDYTHILTNFAPRAKHRDKMATMPQDSEIDILIATDCISEGQNLQDCDLLVNYDIHWNPVRIIQRFGRIDRIGSQNSSIRLINFWPTQDLNKYINLKNRVEARMALVDLAATADDNVLKSENLEELITEDLRYRDKQLLRMKDEILDLEDFNESVSLVEFTLDDFRMELAAYIEANRQKLEETPLGLYAVVPTRSEYATVKPGVVFCLKQKEGAASNEAVNPLQPYFLVYIRDDGEVRYNFTAPKHILEIFRSLCQGQDKPHRKLCEAFDQQTGNGTSMGHYNSLLEKAVAAILAQFKQRNMANLFSGRGGRLVNASDQASQPDDFELITWLVITDGVASDA